MENRTKNSISGIRIESRNGHDHRSYYLSYVVSCALIVNTEICHNYKIFDTTLCYVIKSHLL